MQCKVTNLTKTERFVTIIIGDTILTGIAEKPQGGIVVVTFSDRDRKGHPPLRLHLEHRNDLMVGEIYVHQPGNAL